jgi:hypothetical protein
VYLLVRRLLNVFNVQNSGCQWYKLMTNAFVSSIRWYLRCERCKLWPWGKSQSHSTAEVTPEHFRKELPSMRWGDATKRLDNTSTTPCTSYSRLLFHAFVGLASRVRKPCQVGHYSASRRATLYSRYQQRLFTEPTDTAPILTHASLIW